MDPTICWQLFAAAYKTAHNDGELGEIKETARNLLYWMGRGGFPQTIIGNQEFDRLVERSTCEANF